MTQALSREESVDRRAATVGEPSLSYRIHCSEVWGGTGNCDRELATTAVTASLYASAADGAEGGDIYYLSVCENDLITRIVLADVRGHGKWVTSISKWFYKELVAQMNSPYGHGILAGLNHVAGERGTEAMTTAVILSFHTTDSHLCLSYAGHPPVLLSPHGIRKWIPVPLGRANVLANMPANLPLGVMNDVPYHERRLRLHSGDRMVLYTDGLTDAPDLDGEQFGMERLMTALEAVSEAPLPELKKAVLGAVLKHTHGRLGHDDLTMMALEVR